MVTPTCAPSRCEMTAQSQGVQVRVKTGGKRLKQSVCLLAWRFAQLSIHVAPRPRSERSASATL